jgi:hypothetical protein
MALNAQPPPMQTNRFCKVLRKLDKVTVWPRQRDPCDDGGNVWIATGAG